MESNDLTHSSQYFTQEALRLISSDEFETILKKNKKQCLFCKPSSAKKILFKTDNFYATFDDSPLLEGHIMIHSKVHYGCCGELPAEIFDEFIDLKIQVHDLIEGLYGVCSFYEHGRAGHCSISKDETLCEHFHLHALPLKEDISNEIATQHENERFILNDIRELSSYYEQYDQYLLYENREAIYFFPVIDKVPSHFLRTIIAKKIGYIDRSNWENSTNLELINNLKKKIEAKYE